jgi:bifunctional DNA-binding transcriptional regulator/antitoxin component of YhaV-PrlF toxin-antitoxin module
MVAEARTRQVVVQGDGSVTIPAEVLERAGIKPGDELYFWTTGRGDLNGDLIPDLTLDEMIERFGAKEPVEFDWPTLREEAEEEAGREVIAAMKRNG